MALRIADLRTRIEPVVLLDGNEYEVRAPDAGAAEIYGKLIAMTPIEQQKNMTMVLELLQRVVPTAPMEELKKLEQSQWTGLFLHACGKIAEVEAELKNA